MTRRGTTMPNNTIGLWQSGDERIASRYHVDGATPWSGRSDERRARGRGRERIGLAEDHVNTAVRATTRYVASRRRRRNYAAYIGLFGAVRTEWTTSTTSTRSAPDDRRPRRRREQDPCRLPQHRVERLLPRIVASVINSAHRLEVMAGGFNDFTSMKDSWSGRLLVMASSLAGTTGVVMQPNPGLIGHFKMDEGGGARLKDISGYGNDADIVGSGTWSTGVKKLALGLDGSTHAVVSDQAQLNVTTGLTISGWIQPMAQADQELVSRAAAGVDGYTFGLSSSTAPNPRRPFR